MDRLLEERRYRRRRTYVWLHFVCETKIRASWKESAQRCEAEKLGADWGEEGHRQGDVSSGRLIYADDVLIYASGWRKSSAFEYELKLTHILGTHANMILSTLTHDTQATLNQKRVSTFRNVACLATTIANTCVKHWQLWNTWAFGRRLEPTFHCWGHWDQWKHSNVPGGTSIAYFWRSFNYVSEYSFTIVLLPNYTWCQIHLVIDFVHAFPFQYIQVKNKL